MADPETKRDSSSRVQIIIALIGLAGVVATGLFSNWDHIFPMRTAAPATVASPSVPEKRPERTGKAERADTATKRDPPVNNLEPTGQGSEHPVHSSGGFLTGPGHFDLDTGIEQIAGADFWFEDSMKMGQDRFLTPQNGAAFYVVGATPFESVRWSDMERFPYSTEKSSSQMDHPIAHLPEPWLHTKPTKGAWVNSSLTGLISVTPSAGAPTIDAI